MTYEDIKVIVNKNEYMESYPLVIREPLIEKHKLDTKYQKILDRYNGPSPDENHKYSIYLVDAWIDGVKEFWELIREDIESIDN